MSRDVVREAAAKDGVSLVEGARRYDAQPITRTIGMGQGERGAAAVARIARILENGGATKVADLDRALRETAVPTLAREYLEVWFHYQARHRVSRFNPFLGLSERDAARKFIRAIYDICDRSTGVLGSWYT